MITGAYRSAVRRSWISNFGYVSPTLWDSGIEEECSNTTGAVHTSL